MLSPYSNERSVALFVAFHVAHYRAYDPNRVHPLDPRTRRPLFDSRFRPTDDGRERGYGYRRSSGAPRIRELRRRGLIDIGCNPALWNPRPLPPYWALPGNNREILHVAGPLPTASADITMCAADRPCCRTLPRQSSPSAGCSRTPKIATVGDVFLHNWPRRRRCSVPDCTMPDSESPLSGCRQSGSQPV